MNAKSINTMVAEKIQASGSQPIIDAAVAALVMKENTRRTNALLEGLELAGKIQSELYKAKPDVVSYNEQGEVASQNYSKEKLNERKKLNERLAKVEKALEAATSDKPDFSLLFNLKSNDSSSNTGTSETAG